MIEAEAVAELRRDVAHLRANVEAHVFDSRFRRPFVIRLSLALDSITLIQERLDELQRLARREAA
ncbi:MAG TPA: hypothetical protein VGK94_08345 [Candidatus Polarisedimenticolia bacterium]|jgi:hypothetical protein